MAAVIRCGGWLSMPEFGPRVVAVNVVYQVRRGPNRETAIDKRPVSWPVHVTELGLTGDRQCDTRHHGGVDKAVYAYASEDTAWWAGQLDREITAGLFGENLTTVDVDISNAVIGEHWQIGNNGVGPLLEVRLPRAPCDNLSARIGIPRFHRRFAATGRVGAYLSVLVPGMVAAGDQVVFARSPEHGVTIADWCLRRTPELADRLLRSGIDLAEPLHRAAARLTSHDR